MPGRAAGRRVIRPRSGGISGEAGPATPRAAAGLIRVSDDEDGEAREGDGVWEVPHEALANLTLVLVILHIAGVGLASMVHRENLPRAMIGGRKRPE